MRRVTLQGVLLFLFIPLVLVLFLRQPIGPSWSVGIGLVLMFGHRFVAEPWARRHATRRCAWCAGDATAPIPFSVRAGNGPWPLAACSPRHADLAARFLSFAWRWRVPIGAGVFLPLLLLLAGSLAEGAGHPFISHAANTLQFRLLVAATVVTTSIAFRLGAGPTGPLVTAFPLHNLLLLGIGRTLWVFRLVGAWWLADGVWRLPGLPGS